MTTPQALEEYLDAHGIDGPPTEPGWYVAKHRNGCCGVIYTDWNARHNGAFVGPFAFLGATDDGPQLLTRDIAHTSGGYFSSAIIRYAPFHLAPPGGHALGAAAGDSQTLTPR